MTMTSEALPKRRNWAGNLPYGASDYVSPATLDEARAIVKAAQKLRVVGSRHCFNEIADTTGVQLSLEKLNRVVSLDSERKRVIVEGGIRYGELGPFLHERGYALANMASLPHISIAGACATATHGSGAHRNLAANVAAVEFIDARGELVTLSRETDRAVFAGAAVNLGALGVVSKFTLDLRPAFEIRQNVFRGLPLAAMEQHFDAIMDAAYSVSAFTTWREDVVQQVWIKSEADAAPPLSLFGALPAATSMHPIDDYGPENCTEQMGVPGPSYDRLPHFRMGFTPASGEELQVEYFTPRRHAIGAIRALRGLGARMAPLLLIGEIRTVAADNLWLSPCYETDCVAFHFSFRQDWPALRAILPDIEAALAPFEPRAHWGKMFTLDPATVRARYPRLDDFKRLAARHDPQGKFRNAWIERLLY